MDTVLLDAKFVKLTRCAEVINSNLDLIGDDIAMLVAWFVSVDSLLDIFIDARSLSTRVISTCEYLITCVFGVESSVAKYPLTALSSTAEFCVDGCSDK